MDHAVKSLDPTKRRESNQERRSSQAFPREHSFQRESLNGSRASMSHEAAAAADSCTRRSSCLSVSETKAPAETKRHLKSTPAVNAAIKVHEQSEHGKIMANDKEKTPCINSSSILADDALDEEMVVQEAVHKGWLPSDSLSEGQNLTHWMKEREANEKNLLYQLTAVMESLGEMKEMLSRPRYPP